MTGNQTSTPGGPIAYRDSAPMPGTRRLSSLARRQTVRYSRFVGWAKLLLPTAAGALIVALAAWPYLSPSFERLKPIFPKLDISQVRDLKMINPRYSGIDKEKRPFTVTADTARQPGAGNSNGNDLVALDGPKADLVTKEGAWVVVTGDTGLYQPQAHFLDLFDHVTMFHRQGYVFKTTSARVNLEAGTAEGHEAITGDGPSGTVSAQGFRLLNKGDVVIFTGKSKLILNSVHGDNPPRDSGP